jgi:hypothetical protein
MADSGYSGYSGESGYSGSSGATGYSGISGFSGLEGYSGPSGLSGRSGYSGFSGTFSGYSGFSGPSGLSGRSGWSGFSGGQGCSGFSGYSGRSGAQGTSGHSGSSGSSGYSGFSGAFSGSSGFSGFSASGSTNRISEILTQASHGFSSGEVLYYSGSALARAKADAAVTTDVVGVVEESLSSSQFRIVYAGVINNMTAFSAGIPYFLSDTVAGALTPVLPTTPNTLSKPVVLASDSDSGVVQVLRGFEISAESGGTDRVTTQFDKTTDTALADITGISVPVLAGKTYRMRAVLHVNADLAGGHKYAISGTCTASSIIYYIRSNSGAVMEINSRQTTLGGSAGISVVTSATNLVLIDGTISVATDGTLTVQFAQNSASGTSSVLVGSNFEVTDIS